MQSARILFPAVLVFFFAASAPAEMQIFREWVRPAPSSYTFQHRPQERTRPVVVGDFVYYGTLAGDVYAMHRKEGYVIWHFKMPAGVDGALGYGRSKIFVGDQEGNLIALHARNGIEAWRKKVSGQWLSAPLQLGVRLIATTSTGEVFALGEKNGEELWHFSQRGDEKMTIRGTSAPVVYGSDVYLGFADGNVAALNVENGQVKWKKSLGRRSRFYDVDTSAYADAKNLIVGTFDGSLYSLDRITGDIQWRFPVGSQSGFHVSGDSLYFSGLDKHFYALNLVTGAEVWKTPFDSGVGNAPVPLGDYLLIPTSDDPVYLISQKDGRVAWKGRLGAGTMAAATVAHDNWFYCLSNYGNLYSFRWESGLPLLQQDNIISLPSGLRQQLVQSSAHRNPS